MWDNGITVTLATGCLLEQLHTKALGPISVGIVRRRQTRPCRVGLPHCLVLRLDLLVVAAKCVHTLLTVTEPVMQDGPVGLPVTIILRDLPRVALQLCTDTSASCVARRERIQLAVNVPQASDSPLLR